MLDGHAVTEVIHLTTWQLLKLWIFKKSQPKPEKININSNKTPVIPSDMEITSIAVILDGEVQEILRAENRLSALLLSDPEFIEFNPDEVIPAIGWAYDGTSFIQPLDLEPHQHG
jgi:hypothetical protein